MMTPIIFGIAGEALSADERALFRDSDPAGYILFNRNITSRDQLRALTDDLRTLSGRDRLPILIDQEGGRVSRLQPPLWPSFPAGTVFDGLYTIAPMTAIEAARLNAEAMGMILRDVGITVNCAPVLDLRHSVTHGSIGDRSLGSNPVQVAALGRAMLDGLAAGGVVGVLKHCPGQGRAAHDTHHALARVTVDSEALESDLMPFKMLSNAPIAMTSHVVYEAWDSEHPATQSTKVITQVIRGAIGFDGLLLSDDLTMDALGGSMPERVLVALSAGCDIGLHCSADLEDMRAIAAVLPPISAVSEARMSAAMARAEPTRDPGDHDQQLSAALHARDQLLAVAA
jgi:beta-N-acetylhexosaminidase